MYALAKLAELADGANIRATGWVSGHALKHLLAAAAVGTLAWMLSRRRSFAAGRALDVTRADLHCATTARYSDAVGSCSQRSL